MEKTVIPVTVLISFLLVMSPAKSQDGFGTLSTEVGFPIGDFQKTHMLVWGIGLGYERPLGDAFAIGGNVGYNFVAGKEVTDEATGFTIQYDNTYMIPVQGFGKYYLQDQQEGAYLQINAGVHFYKAMQVTYDPVWGTPQYTYNVEKAFSFAPAIGFALYRADMNLRYQFVSTSPSADYITFKVAYLLFASN